MEEDLYKDYLPKNYKANDVIVYQWYQNQDYDLKGHFNFYYSIFKNKVSIKSMFIYLVLILTIGIVGNILYDLLKYLIGL